jgi:hypothetical protein
MTPPAKMKIAIATPQKSASHFLFGALPITSKVAMRTSRYPFSHEDEHRAASEREHQYDREIFQHLTSVGK